MVSGYDLWRVLHVAACRLAELAGLLTDQTTPPARLQQAATPSSEAVLLGVAPAAPLVEVSYTPEYANVVLTVLVSEPVYLDGNALVCGGFAASLNPLDVNAALLVFSNPWIADRLSDAGLTQYSVLFRRVESVAELYVERELVATPPKVVRAAVTARKGGIEVYCEMYALGKSKYTYYCAGHVCGRRPDFVADLVDKDTAGELASAVVAVSSQLSKLLRLARFAAVVYRESLKPP